MESSVASSGARELDLVLRHRYGDAQAFTEVFRLFEPMVYNLAHRLAGEREEAEDLTQEVFLRIYRHLGSFQGRSSLKTWIYRITLNHCRSRLGRQRVRWETLELPGGGERPLPAAGPGPERRAMARDDHERLVVALRALPIAFREAVLLRDVEELSYQEIAEVLGKRIGTVRSRIARGRERLRQLLEAP